MKKTISRFVERFGYTIVPTWRLGRLAMADRLRQIFSDYKIEKVIDVGANQGQYRDFLRMEVGFDGAIDSFEPTPDLVKLLERRATREDPKWSIHGCALGAEAGDVNINIMAQSLFNSFRKPAAVQNAKQARNTVVGTAMVPVSTLDVEFADTAADLRRTYLKLDTQGFDLDVMRGGKRVMSSIPALQTEISFIPIYENIPDYRTAIMEFEKRGFGVADIFLVATDDKHRAVEFDCVMVRSDDCGRTRTS